MGRTSCKAPTIGKFHLNSLFLSSITSHLGYLCFESERFQRDRPRCLPESRKKNDRTKYRQLQLAFDSTPFKKIIDVA